MLLIKRFVLVIVTCAICFVANAQRETSQYEATYIDIVGMLEDQQSLDF